MAGVISGCGDTRWGAVGLLTGARGLVTGDQVISAIRSAVACGEVSHVLGEAVRWVLWRQ